MIAFHWNWDPLLVVPLAAAGIFYVIGWTRLWRAGHGVAWWRAASFAAGWLALAAPLVSPLRNYAEHLFLAHMIEHEVLMVVAAPLFALSRPLDCFASALPPGSQSKIVHLVQTGFWRWLWQTMTAPTCTTALHAVAIWTWHLPVLMDGTVLSPNLHRLQHFFFLATALLFWWAILGRPRKTFGAGTLHLFVTQVHTGLLGALLTMAPRVVYPLQTRDAVMFGLTPLADQQLAGLIMWVPGGVIYLVCELLLIYFWLGNSGAGGRMVPRDGTKINGQVAQI